jgi:hypothetical protein
MAAINLNADHLKGWEHTLGTEHRFPCVILPAVKGLSSPAKLWINEPTGSTMSVYNDVARIIANAPEVARRACDVLEGLDTVNLPKSMAARVRKLREALAKSCG